MNMMKMLVVGIMACLGASAAAQTPQPYAGMQERPIKALSQQQIADLKAGRGMGLALAAELNGYPGPSHLLELASELRLSPDQQAAIKAMFDAMKAEAIPIGENLIGQEEELDHLFANHTVTPEALQAATARIGETQARLREAHLKYHLSTVALLQPQQLQQYAALRGYASDSPEHHHGTHQKNQAGPPL